jgi:DNA-binding NarL/FixJ family response regulator
MPSESNLTGRRARVDLDPRDKSIVRSRRKARRDAHRAMRRNPIEPTDWNMLTPLLYRVARMLACGYTVHAIARRLRVKSNSAGNYRWQVMRQLQVENQTLLARKAIRDGIVKADLNWDALIEDSVQRGKKRHLAFTSNEE